MSNNRKYLIFEDTKSTPSLHEIFDECIVAIEEGSTRLSNTRNEAGYPSYKCFRIQGREILVNAVLEYYLFKAGGSDFDYDKAVAFTEKMRKLCGWSWDIDTTLRYWVERVIRAPFFEQVNDSYGYPEWKLKAGEPSWQLSESYLRFACYIAISKVKYMGGDGQYAASEIFKIVTALGSKLPADLKKNGSGDLPLEIRQYKTDLVMCDANDVFATVKIKVKEDSEEAYSQVLDFLCNLLSYGFPSSYTIKFSSSEKNWLAIKSLPKKGVHQLFANAIKWQALHPQIENYARLAMKEFEWYNDLEDEYCAMPGTFAVFALGLLGERYHPLLCDYLSLCDGEHQSLQGDFVLAYVEQYGFTDLGLELYDLCDQNIQHLPKKLTTLYAKRK
ncbi:DUF6138 family protein [Sphingobacterium paucimobilis]|uniref:Uncharacterized protein n=1 Tax=Sphingobacterium paucimobilis HER1398 TaxID=1346330 RepID=U2JCL2_9SPHI|nr:DUF6138 family protein [Sphingobacterium paucimobilis]ERJ60413.1 hypothetical protein M472_16800 [Sphingobacterium paucimobilis HER1398]